MKTRLSLLLVFFCATTLLPAATPPKTKTQTLGSASAGSALTAPATFPLFWDDNNPASGNVTAYVLYEKVGSTYQLVTTIPAPTKTVTLTGVGVGVHTYVVTAKNAAEETGYSNEYQQEVVPPKLVPPSSLRGTLN